MAKSYGGGYPKHGNSNNSGGGTQPKTGKHYTPLCRKSQYSSTMGAMMSRVRSQHPHMDKHYQYEGISEDQGGHVLGYSPE